MPGIHNNYPYYYGHVPYTPWSLPYHTWPYSYNYPYKPLPTFTPYPDYAPFYPTQPVAPTVRIASILAYSPKPAWSWDIGLPLSTAYPRPPADVLAAPATTPTLPTLSINCPMLPWTITVNAGADPNSRPRGAPAAFVTIGDVLVAIHNNVRLAVVQAEFDTFLSPDQKYWVGVDFRIRCGGNQSEYSKGLRRMDFLGGRRKFLGLSSSSRGPDMWTLNLG